MMSGKELKKICANISTNLIKWKLQSKEGKIVLESIIEKLYKVEEEEKKTVEEYDEETQKNCDVLTEILIKMKTIVEEFESVEEKCLGLSQLINISSSSVNKPENNTSVISSSSSHKSSENSSFIELESSVVYTGDLSHWSQVISECLR